MSEMVERLAEALWQAESERATERRRLVTWADEGEDTHCKWRFMARAAIEAMREPTKEMWDAWWIAADDSRDDYCNEKAGYASMIDAALKEKPE